MKYYNKPNEISAEILFTIRKALPHGSRKIIAKRTGTSQYYVTYMLLGFIAPDEKVIKACVDYIKEYREKLQEKKEVVSEVEALRNALPYGSRKIIAKRSGKSISYVTRVLLGHYQPNKKVITAAKEYLEEISQHKGIKERLIDSVKKIAR